MIYYSCKNPNQRISKLGFGLMRLPTLTEGSEEIDYPRAQALIDTAIENGVNYFDTAYGYHSGESEEFIGEALKKYDRASYYLTSKLPGWLLMNKATPESLLEFQLNRCGTDYFDYYLLHSVTEDNIDKYESSNAYNILTEKKEKGIIRNLGFSFHGGLELFKRLLDEYEWDVVQLQLNYYDWDEQNAREKYELLAQRNIPCIVMEPVRGGSLHKLNDEARAVFADLPEKRTPASYALRFAAQLPNVMTVLSGMSDMNQVLNNLQTFNRKLEFTEEESAAVDKAKLLFRKNFAIPCTDCRYCTSHCPNGVEIPTVFKAYNEYNKSRDYDDFTGIYTKIPKEHNADACIACNACSPNCPQKIDIPKELSKAARLDK